MTLENMNQGARVAGPDGGPEAAGERRVALRIRGEETSDGGGVRLTRIIGSRRLGMLDPFLLLDAFRSDEPTDYIAGFPPHPHRGFETVTYLLAGRMRHRDSAGHEGVIESGGVQWMTAGRGIVHSEMPEQEDGLLAGFQLWINLPAAEKMRAPRYQEFSPDQIPEETRGEGARLRVIAGETSRGTVGPVAEVTTAPLYLDASLASGAELFELLPPSHNAFVYVVEGAVDVPAGAAHNRVLAGELAALTAAGAVRLSAGAEGARLLLVAARRLGEPVARRGPFVMSTEAELEQAFRDYREGRF